jgi:hypothetical protein
MSLVDLTGVIPQTQIMIISVTASTTSGVPLEPAEGEVVQEACT